MSEVLTIDAAMPRGYEKLDAIKIYNPNDGIGSNYGGIISFGEGETAIERTAQNLPGLDEMWGYDPNDFEFRKSNPKLWERLQWVDELTARVQDLEDRNQDLEQKLAQLKGTTSPESNQSFRDRMRGAFGAGPRRAHIYFINRNLEETPDEGQEIIIEEKRRGAAGAILGSAAVGAVVGVAAYWLLARHTGHNFDQTAILNQEHITQSKVDALTKNLNNFEVQNHAENVHAHAHDLRAIHGLHNQIARDHAQEMRTIHGVQTQLHQAGAHETMSGGGSHSATASEHVSAAASRPESLGYKGDTIWSDVSKHLSAKLGRSPTTSELSRATAHVLKVNDLSWAQARHLPVGYHYKIPGNLVTVARG